MAMMAMLPSAAAAALQQQLPWQYAALRALQTAPPPPSFKAPQPTEENADQQGKQQQRQQQEEEEEKQGRGNNKAPAPPGGASLTSLPNLLSLSRVAAAPVAAWTMAAGHWGAAAALLAAAGATDWADGALARRLGHTSKLGSYLDPLADKIFVVTVVVTLGSLGLLPAWLATLVAVRDAGQVAVTARHRLAMFGGRWPGLAAFADVDGAPPLAAAAGAACERRQGEEAGGGAGAGSGDIEQQQHQQPAASEAAGTAAAGTAAAGTAAAAEMPRIRPLFVSKLNTALALLLVGGAVTAQWQGVPGPEALAALEAAVGATTAGSGLAYLWLWRQGRLLQR